MPKAERVELSDMGWGNVILGENAFVQMSDGNHSGHGDSSKRWTRD